MSRILNKREAEEFASIIVSGAPIAEAVHYFVGEQPVTEEDLLTYEETWPLQDHVVEALRTMTGGEPWNRMTDTQRLDVSLVKHYNEMAYFLWTTNYAECDGGTKMKADTCRQAIEAKVAGMAGRESPLAQFYHDLLIRYDQQGKAVN